MKELYTIRPAEDECFACINSGKGFICRFDELSDGCYTYVIKGGPGTGKSGLMKHIAQCARARGEEVLRILCSSDPDSLDGVILKNRKIALVDGTSPHSSEPKIPGVSGELVNLGAFWNGVTLSERKSEITEYGKRKSLGYQNVFSLLSSAFHLAECRIHMLTPLLRGRAPDCEIKKILPPPDAAPKARLLQMSGLGMKGALRLFPARENANRILYVKPFFGGEYLVLEKMKQSAEKSGVSFLYSLDPISLLPERLFFPKSRLLVCPGKKGESSSDAVFDTKTFFSQIGKEQKDRLRRYEREEQKLTELALAELSDLSTYHFALEKIYGSAMDFLKVEELKSVLEKRIFG